MIRNLGELPTLKNRKKNQKDQCEVPDFDTDDWLFGAIDIFDIFDIDFWIFF